MTYSPVSSEMSWWANSRSRWQQPLINDGFLSANGFGITWITGELSVKSAFVRENTGRMCCSEIPYGKSKVSSIVSSTRLFGVFRNWVDCRAELILCCYPFQLIPSYAVSLQLAECWLNSTLLKCCLLPLPCAAVTRLSLWTVSFQTLVIPSENSRYDLSIILHIKESNWSCLCDSFKTDEY